MHPNKRARPIARGELSPRLAELIAVLLLFSAVFLVAPLGLAGGARGALVGLDRGVAREAAREGEDRQDGVVDAVDPFTRSRLFPMEDVVSDAAARNSDSTVFIPLVRDAASRESPFGVPQRSTWFTSASSVRSMSTLSETDILPGSYSEFQNLAPRMP